MANAKREGKAQTEGSKTDKVLKWSVLFAGNVEAYSKVLDVYMSKARALSVRLVHPRLYPLDDGDAGGQDGGFLAGLPNTKHFPPARTTAREEGSL